MRIRSSNNFENQPPAPNHSDLDEETQFSLNCINAGLLTVEEVRGIKRYAARSDIPFTQAAVALRLLDSATVRLLQARSYNFPLLEPGDDRLDPRVIAAFDPYDPYVGDIRSIRSELTGQWLNDPVDTQHSIALLGADASVDLGIVASNLGVAWAQLGWPTLLVDGDLEAPSLHELFRVPNSFGLSTIVNNPSHSKSPLVTPIDNLHFLPAGPGIPNAFEALERRPLLTALERHRRQYRLMIVTLSRIHADHFGGLDSIFAGFEGVIIVVRRGVSSLRPLARLVNQLRRRNVPVFGTVIDH